MKANKSLGDGKLGHQGKGRSLNPRKKMFLMFLDSYRKGRNSLYTENNLLSRWSPGRGYGIIMIKRKKVTTFGSQNKH